MKISRFTNVGLYSALVCLAAAVFARAQVVESPRVAAAGTVPAAPASSSVASAAKPSRFQFLLFWNESSPQTQQIAETLKTAAAKRPERLEWSAVNVRDPANAAIVEQYQVSRVPMPMVLCVAPNGAVTGAYVRQFNEAAVERSLVTPLMADVTKALQDKKIVLLHVKPAATSSLPAAATEFVADPAFHARTTIMSLVLTDPAEKRFLDDMKVTAGDVGESMLVVMAPPGVLVGKFPANVTKDQVAAQLHAAGKCCDDPNCKHNKKEQP